MQTPVLSIRLFGPLALYRGDQLLPDLVETRAATLLAYLVLHREFPQSRQRLAFLLWPDSSEAQARTNLRHVLHDLRRALPDADRFLDVTPRTLRWRPEAPFWLDVAAFADALKREGENGTEDQLAALREAVALYRGDLLEGLDDEWLLPERELLRGRYLAALERLAVLLAARGVPREAIALAERLISEDPLNEATYQLLMRLHAARGQPARVLQTYHLCSATLERELGVEPSSATRQVYETLMPATGAADAAEFAARIVATGDSPLVGRMIEWSRLTEIWLETERNRAQVVLVSGEAGAGKTRLVDEIRRWAERRRAVTATARSYAAEGAMAYGPLVTWLRSPSFASHLSQLDRAAHSDLALLLPDLFPQAEIGTLPDTLADTGRQRLFAAAARAIHAAGGPVLLVADDIHWCDPETLRFMHYLLRVRPDFPLLVVATVRQEEIDDDNPINVLIGAFRTLDSFSEIALGRLTEEETALLATQLGRHPVPEEAAARLFRETEGNPLFVVEAVRAGWDGRDEEVGLSPRMQAVIAERLAQLSAPARELVGLAATVGREFTPEVLGCASEASEEPLVNAMDELWRRRIIRELGADGYDFSHDKIREVAYRVLSPMRRRHYHLRVATALERLYGDDLGPVSGQIAAHYERAAALQQATVWYVRAAETARQLYANAEAVRLLDHALDLLGSLPASADRQVRELAILAALLTPLGTIEGWASERLATVQQRALDLAEALGVEPAPSLLRSLSIASLSRRDFAAAHSFGIRLRARGELDADEVSRVESEYLLGIVAFWRGELSAAHRHFAEAVDRYQPEHRRAHLHHYGLDPKVICSSRLGNTLWFLGYPEAAIRARDAALALAGEIAHPYTRSVALVFATLLSLDMQDTDGVRAFTEKLRAEHANHEMRANQIACEQFGGYVDVLDGRVTPGIARIQSAVDETREGDQAPGMHAHALRVLAGACAVAGDAGAGLIATDAALVRGDPVRLWEAEIRRLRAEFLAARNDPASEVEAELARSIEVAQHQGSVMLELRAAVSLVQYRRTRGDPAVTEAREHLATIVAALPKDRECWDVRKAVATLDAF